MTAITLGGGWGVRVTAITLWANSNKQKFLLSALAYIFGKTETDDSRKVATCKEVYQLYV